MLKIPLLLWLMSLCLLAGCIGAIEHDRPVSVFDKSPDQGMTSSLDMVVLPEPPRDMTYEEDAAMDMTHEEDAATDMTFPDDGSSDVSMADVMLATGERVVMSSLDRGESWQSQPLPEGLDVVRGALWAEEMFWLYGEGREPLWQSEDGVTWAAVNTAGQVTGVSALAYHDGLYMGVYGRDIIHAESTASGLEWTHVADTIPEDAELLDITWANGTFIAVGTKIVAYSEDGKSWSERRGWEPDMREVRSNGKDVVSSHQNHLRLSSDGKMWRSFYGFCEESTNTPSLPVFTDRGVMFAECEGRLRARSIDDGEWRQVGRAGEMPTPLLFAHDRLIAVDAQGSFWTSATGFDWEQAQGDARGVTQVIASGQYDFTTRPPEAPACQGGVLRCIDFEQELVGLPPLFQLGLASTKANSVRIDDSRAFSGSHSMRVDVVAGERAQRGLITFEGEDFDPTLQDKIYARMMFYTANYPIRNWHMSESWGPLNAQNMTRIQYNAGAEGDRAFHNYYGNGKDCWNRSDFVYPSNQWFCWQVEYDRAANTMVISVDGEEVHRLSGMGEGCLGGPEAQSVWQAPMRFDGFRIGYKPFKPQEQDLTAWIDDVAISNQPISCP